MKKFPYKPTLKRYRILALFFTLLAVAVIGKAAYTMFVKRSFWVQLSERNVKEGIKLPSTRGNIFSADGQLLATSLPEFKVYIIPDHQCQKIGYVYSNHIQDNH